MKGFGIDTISQRKTEEAEVSEEGRTWPQKELGKRLSNWGRWGDDDELGTLNFVTAQKRLDAGGLIKTGRIFDLGIPFDSSGPQLGGATASGRFNPIHTMTMTPVDPLGAPDGTIAADDIITMGLQCATQWDSLAHVGYDGLLYNNTPASAVNARAGATRLSFAKCVERMTSRGVLLDIPRLHGVDRLEDSTEITSDDLTAAENRQGVKVGSGDILLIRTGAYQHFLAGDRERYLGLEAGLGLSCLEWLHEREVAAVAVDNYGVEVFPARVEGSIIPFHQVALRDMGLILGEMFVLEELADDCDRDGVSEFFFTGAGLKISYSVGAPVTPMAIK